jgi:excisionase family DNA binding protein
VRDSKDLSLPEAAQLLGVHYMTAYRYVRTGRLDAVRTPSGWRVPRTAVDALRAESRPAGGRTPTRSLPSGRRPKGDRTTGPKAAAKPGRSNEERARRLLRRLVAGDEAGAWSLLEEALVSGSDPSSLYVEVISPALRSIGKGWETGRLDVADEHRAAYVAERLIARLGPLCVRRGPSRGLVVVAAAEGERHALPLAMVADLLRAEGLGVVAIGADTPAASIALAVERAARERPSATVLLLGATTAGNERSISAAVDAVRHAAPDVPVAVGGAAVRSKKAALALGADAWTGPDGRSAVTVARDLIRDGRSAPSDAPAWRGRSGRR